MFAKHRRVDSGCQLLNRALIIQSGCYLARKRVVVFWFSEQGRHGHAIANRSSFRPCIASGHTTVVCTKTEGNGQTYQQNGSSPVHAGAVTEAMADQHPCVAAVSAAALIATNTHCQSCEGTVIWSLQDLKLDLQCYDLCQSLRFRELGLLRSLQPALEGSSLLRMMVSCGRERQESLFVQCERRPGYHFGSLT